MSPTFLDPEKPRPLKLAAIVVGALVAVALLTSHVIYWSAGLPREKGDPPEFQADPSFPDPRVLHQSPVALTFFAVKVPYQAGIYEIAEALPGELTLVYREANAAREARVVVFTRTKLPRWQALTPFPGSWRLKGGLDADRLLEVLRAERSPGFLAHLLPWRLIGWTADRQIRERILAEGRPARLVRLWSVKNERYTAIGREYEELERAGRLVAVTLYADHRSADLLLSFNSSDPSNLALVQAYLNAIDFGALRGIDNVRNLALCDSLAGSTVEQTAMRVCKEIYLSADWAAMPANLSRAEDLYKLYKENQVTAGLKLMAERLSLLRFEDPNSRRLLQQIEADLAPPAEAAPPAPAVATEEAPEGTLKP